VVSGRAPPRPAGGGAARWQPAAPVTFEGMRWLPGLSFHIKRHALADVGGPACRASRAGRAGCRGASRPAGRRTPTAQRTPDTRAAAQVSGRVVASGAGGAGARAVRWPPSSLMEAVTPSTAAVTVSVLAICSPALSMVALARSISRSSRSRRPAIASEACDISRAAFSMT